MENRVSVELHLANRPRVAVRCRASYASVTFNDWVALFVADDHRVALATALRGAADELDPPAGVA